MSAYQWLGPKNRGRGSAWLLTVGILSNKEWGDFRTAQGRLLCRAAGGGHPKFCCHKRHQLGRTAQQRSVVSSESKGACLQTDGAKLLMKAKLLAPPTHNITPFTSAQRRRQFPDPGSARVRLAGPPEPLHCCQMQVPGPPRPEPGLWRPALSTACFQVALMSSSV